ncbi:MAG: hypothetical protein NTX50_17255 [Candidatus Sumerlaeota bacterium]|nr:hypothetical protein [Candidatus Sumerlaeota bacterium]
MKQFASLAAYGCLALILNLAFARTAPAAPPAAPAPADTSPNAIITLSNQGSVNLSLYIAPADMAQWDEHKVRPGESLPISLAKGKYQALWGSYGAGGMDSIVPGTQNGKADDIPVQKAETWLFIQQAATPTIKVWTRKVQSQNAGAPAQLAVKGAAPAEAAAGQVVKEKGFELRLPEGWTRAADAPQGFDVAFRKKLPGGAEASILIRRQTIPPESLKTPLNPADVRKQFEEIMKQQYPGVTAQPAPPVKVAGQMLFNLFYDISKGGKISRLRCAYFVQGNSAFLVQCAAQAESWNTVAPEFDGIMGNIKSGN